MKVSTFNGVKVYNLSTGKAFPQWLSESQKRKLAKDEEYRKRIDIIQDFEVTTAAQRVRLTSDGNHILVAGTYPPCFRCYTLTDMSLKFHRGLTCDVVDFESLSSDFSKVAFLLSDRTLNFHAAYGTHYSVRVPKFGRDLKYSWDTCDLFVGSSGDEVYRLNLDSGQFKEPLKLGFSGCNKMHINPVHQLLGCGGEEAVCEFWDCRHKKNVASIVVDEDKSIEVTALKFDTDGMTLGVGTSNGRCILYDIRSSKPLFTKDHQYELPIIDVSFHGPSRHIISTDKKVIKIWDREEPNTGKILTNIEAPCDLNDVTMVCDNRGPTGMLFAAGEQSRLMTYFIPQLGPAPRWCSFLENLTEELEETSGQTVYEDYKFLTEQEVKDLGASGLIGTPMLKGYMHGYFIDMKLYHDLRAVSKAYDYEAHRKKLIQDKIKAKAESHIAPRVRVRVNKKSQEKLASVAQDDRFSALFNREEFEIDEDSLDFKLRNPVTAKTSKKGGRFAHEDEDRLDQDYDLGMGEEEDDSENHAHASLFRKMDIEDSQDKRSNSRSGSHNDKSSHNNKSNKGKASNNLYEASTSLSNILTMKAEDQRKLGKLQNQSLSQRVAAMEQESQHAPITKSIIKRNSEGDIVHEVSYIPKESDKKDSRKNPRNDRSRSGGGKRRREEEESFASMMSR